jgi:putative transposase
LIRNDKAVEYFIKDRNTLLAFYDFSTEHRKHLRTTNVIVNPFAIIRHRMVRSKGCLSNKTAFANFQTCRFRREKAAEPRWPQPVAENHPRCKVRRRN